MHGITSWPATVVFILLVWQDRWQASGVGWVPELDPVCGADMACMALVPHQIRTTTSPSAMVWPVLNWAPPPWPCVHMPDQAPLLSPSPAAQLGPCMHQIRPCHPSLSPPGCWIVPSAPAPASIPHMMDWAPSLKPQLYACQIGLHTLAPALHIPTRCWAWDHVI